MHWSLKSLLHACILYLKGPLQQNLIWGEGEKRTEGGGKKEKVQLDIAKADYTNLKQECLAACRPGICDCHNGTLSSFVLYQGRELAMYLRAEDFPLFSFFRELESFYSVASCLHIKYFGGWAGRKRWIRLEVLERKGTDKRFALMMLWGGCETCKNFARQWQERKEFDSKLFVK